MKEIEMIDDYELTRFRGWSKGMLKLFAPEPVMKTHVHWQFGNHYRLFYKADEIAKAEKTQDFQKYWNRYKSTPLMKGEKLNAKSVYFAK